MSDFKPIETQEELDKIIAERVARAKATVAKEFEGYLSKEEYEKLLNNAKQEYENSSKKLNETLEELKSQNKKYESASVKARIAHEIGLPYEMASRLTGETEEEITKDAEALKAIFGDGKPSRKAPEASSEPLATKEGREMAAYKNMLKKMEGES